MYHVSHGLDEHLPLFRVAIKLEVVSENRGHQDQSRVQITCPVASVKDSKIHASMVRTAGIIGAPWATS